MYSSFIYHYKPYLSWPLKATVRSKDDNTVLVTGGQGVTLVLWTLWYNILSAVAKTILLYARGVVIFITISAV